MKRRQTSRSKYWYGEVCPTAKQTIWNGKSTREGSWIYTRMTNNIEGSRGVKPNCTVNLKM
jgi:hypothetical protein